MTRLRLNSSLDEAWQGRPALGIAWQIGSPTGWGVYGLNLTLQLLRSRQYFPLPFRVTRLESLTPLHRLLLRPVLPKIAQMERSFAAGGTQDITCKFPVLRALGEYFNTSPWVERIWGTKNIAVIFFGDVEVPPDALARARRHDLIVTGSTWNYEALKNAGLTNVVNVLQGIDPTVFHPGPRARWFGDRFVVFSGGKLEFHKGQDLVIAAYKRFHARHPEALLLTAWHNIWPETIQGLARSPHLVGLPSVGQNGRLNIREWLLNNGLPDESFRDIGPLQNEATGQVLRECDVGIFPSRSETGTNLVAMECMACGVPAILSANTGHLDLIRADTAFSLTRQGPVSSEMAGAPAIGWGESDVEEMVDALEQVFQNRDEARRRGVAGAELLRQLTWELQVAKFTDAIAAI